MKLYYWDSAELGNDYYGTILVMAGSVGEARLKARACILEEVYPHTHRMEAFEAELAVEPEVSDDDVFLFRG